MPEANDLPLMKNGCIALLRSKPYNILEWEVLKPIIKPGWYSEMEVPQIYQDSKGNELITFSTWSRWDNAPNTQKKGGFHCNLLRI